ncbi:Bug family tripartite tricarboxylate transporter substrate binding protein [Alicycliphilus denitrificans]|jgi:tripartite-type tricarboxylate transporter receptor subunit TctC|uniref:Tripartite tricarboxylate transporter substrate binding protein n=1 Tax=Alicycliphilus denitrificans TaxID=179636 RepID=A0A3R7HTZ5_9BURK|nr:tripartite tricarboxylate transporter substrate binding protein [Alicycliphilus denitrificans]RKJ95064.1 tripartite tricarboxylate transporter substrate binding protein [Alicycliphilus denitrificans]
MISKRHLLAACALVAFGILPAQADTYPSRPIRIIVHSSPGALLDVTTRVVAQEMSKDLGQPIVIENRPGADGLLGIRAVKAAPADGYTLLAAANTVAQLPAFRKEPGYDLEKDFTGIGMMNRAPFLFVGPPGQPSKTLAELIANAKAQPGQLVMAHAGKGTSVHMAAALFFHQTGTKFLDVPYKGAAAALPDVVGGRANVMFDGANSSGPLVKEGKLRAFGITSTTRSPVFPDIPTLAEQGLPNYSFYVYLGLLAPANVPKDVVPRLAKALRTALASEPVKERFRNDAAEAGRMSPEEFTKFLKEDAARTEKVATDLGYAKE